MHSASREPPLGSLGGTFRLISFVKLDCPNTILQVEF